VEREFRESNDSRVLLAASRGADEFLTFSFVAAFGLRTGTLGKKLEKANV
jgi:hypothetical protein